MVGQLRFSDRPINRQLCFVLMPFRAEFDSIYLTIRESVTIDNQLQCLRADDIYSTGIVIDEVFDKICEAQTLIADVTGKNGNVLYELGLGHALDKTAIIISQSVDDVPFDLKHRRLLIYDSSDLHGLRARLSKTIDAIRWRTPNIEQWLETDSPSIRVGLATPKDGDTSSTTPIEAVGRILGLPQTALRFRIQAFVLTNREYPQSSGWVDADGFWRIPQIHLGGYRHKVSFRIFDEAERLIAKTKSVSVMFVARAQG